MRTFLSFLYLLFISSVSFSSEKQDTLKYRITLVDKAKTPYSLEKPDAFLSPKAILRRQKQHIAIDSLDLPVCQEYIQEIEKCGVRILVTSKWENSVTVSCNKHKNIEKIQHLPFVRKIELVWRGPSAPVRSAERDSISNAYQHIDSTYFGSSAGQLQLCNMDKVHESGFRGQGMTIGVIDAGFHNTDRITAMSNIHILGTHDFVDKRADIYAEDSHGMKVLSCMAMNQPHIMIGSAPEASYWLLRSEDTSSETLVEQDYWAAAVEFADSVGCDVLNTSLGYFEFDDKSLNYELRHLDGKYSLMSRQASRIAAKGMILVCSAGNSGKGRWKKITPPADAKDVITVGAVNKEGVLAPFSSVGHTADNRIKPDVVAVGEEACVMGTDGVQTHANGTSFASPLICGMVACLWQARPELTATQVITLVRSLGDRAQYPDNIYGYGIPDFQKGLNP